jgi:hypothetical protein
MHFSVLRVSDRGGVNAGIELTRQHEAEVPSPTMGPSLRLCRVSLVRHPV